MKSRVIELITKWKEKKNLNFLLNAKGNSKATHMKPGSLVKDKSLTHLLVRISHR